MLRWRCSMSSKRSTAGGFPFRFSGKKPPQPRIPATDARDKKLDSRLVTLITLRSHCIHVAVILWSQLDPPLSRCRLYSPGVKPVIRRKPRTKLFVPE